MNMRDGGIPGQIPEIEHEPVGLRHGVDGELRAAGARRDNRRNLGSAAENGRLFQHGGICSSSIPQQSRNGSRNQQ